MTTQPDDSAAQEHVTANRRSRLGIGLSLVGMALLIGALIWGFTVDKPAPSVDIPPSAPVSEAPAAVTNPSASDTIESVVLPEREPDLPPVTAPEPTIELTLAEANTQLAERLSELQIAPIDEQFASKPNAIERGVAIADILRQGEVPYKLLPVARPKQKFPFADNGLAVTMDPAGFARYDGLTNTLSSLDVNTTITLFREYQSTIDQAWQALGYTDNSVEPALLEALELIMLTPDIQVDARLLKDEANWIYEDESLEKLPALQKQIMRMGPENAERLKALARDLRGGLLDTQ